MLLKWSLAATQFAAALAASATCNPLKSSCSPVPALGTSLVEDFKEKPSKFDISAVPSGVSYTDNGLDLTLKKRGDNPAVQSDFYIMFGRVEVIMKAAPGKGVVSSFILQSDDLDEIDIEFLGGDDTQVQSNYFSKGDTTTYDRGEYHSTPGAPQDHYFNYTIDWTDERVIWYVEGQNVRTLHSNDPQGFPQSPMYIKAGIWAGGDPSNPSGTIEWAGGETDFSQAPFSMHILELRVNDYSSGDKYEYTDQSGSWKSIKAVNGEVNGRSNTAIDGSNDDSSSSSSSSSGPSSSSTSSSASPSSSSSSSSDTPSTSSTTTSSSSSTAPTSHASSTETSSTAHTPHSSAASTLSTSTTGGSSDQTSSSGSGSGSETSQTSSSAEETSETLKSSASASSSAASVSSYDSGASLAGTSFLALVALAMNF